MACRVEFTEQYKTYLDLCVSADPRDLSVSVQDVFGKQFRDDAFEVLEIGDGVSDRCALVTFPDGRKNYLERGILRVVEGSWRGLPRRGRIVMGSGSLSGRIAKGIKSGRAFQGK